MSPVLADRADSRRESTEQDLIGRVLRGEHECFHELIRPYQRRVYAVARAILQNDFDAEEVAQETLLKTFRHLKSFRGEARFSTWLLRIALNEARIWLRKSKPGWQVPLPGEEAGEDSRDYVPLLLADWRLIPSNVLEKKEIRQKIDEAIAKLTPEHREVLLLRDMTGLNIAETSEALGITPGLVKVRLLRARLRMRDLLAPVLGRESKKKGGGK